MSFSNRLILVYSAIEDINPYTIIKYLEQYLPRYMIPSKVDQWNSLPRNKNGKIDRKEIKKMYTNDFDKDTIKQKVREIIEGISGEYDEDDIDLGTFDSIIFIQIIMAIEEEYDFEFDEEVLSFENLCGENCGLHDKSLQMKFEMK
ncbi:MAG: phosphopantetheine-binding protein [Oscillospiraceae bacterium]